MKDLRLGLPALLMLLLVRANQTTLVFALCAGFIVTLAGLVFHRRNLAPLVASLLLTIGVCAIIGPGILTFHGVCDRSDPFASAIDDGRYITAEATLTSYPESDSTSAESQTLAQLQSVDGTHSQHTVRLRSSSTIAAQWRRGDRIRLSGIAEESYEGDRAYGQISVTQAQIVAHGLAFPQRIHDVLVENTHPLVVGVVVGDDSRLSEEDTQRIRQLGLSHLTAVSGAHVSLVIMGVVMLIGRSYRWLTAILAMLALAALIVIVGNEPSVTRASIMGALVIFALAIKRPATAFPLLCCTVIVVSLVSPRTAQSLGFLLSTAATAAIVLFGRPLSSLLSRFLPATVTELVAIPFVAGTATLPVLASIQSVFSLWTVLANAIVAPVVAPLTISGLFGGILGTLSTTLATPFLAIAQASAWWIIWCSRMLVKLPGSSMSLPTVLLVHLALLAGVVVIGYVGPNLRAVAGIGLVLLIGLALQRPASIDGEWKAIACDVGQGSALLVRGGGRVVMIDVGPANSKVGDCLRAAGVRHIDLLIVSHFDADHVRGLEDVLAVSSVDEVWVSENTYPRHNSEWANRLLKMNDASVTGVRAGATLTWRSGTHVTLRASVISPRVVRGGESETNADSLAVVVETANLAIYALGDIDEFKQDQLAEEVPVNPGAIRVVLVPHHGAASQSQRLRDAINPHVAIFSVGENTYGHPTRNALRLWQTERTARTDQCGSIAITVDALIAQCSML